MKTSFPICRSFLCLCTLVLLLAGCSTSGIDHVDARRNHYYQVKNPQQCVPYARKVSGLPIYGDAYTWWSKAKASGQYNCGNRPVKGAVMALNKTKRLRYGHLAVVSRVIDNRTIEVSHSNWGGDKRTRSIVYEQMPVKDVSANNDWSSVRFWHYPTKSFGSPYPVQGFISHY